MLSNYMRAAATAVLACTVSLAAAQTYPEHPITVVTPFPAGGATDVLARSLVEDMGKRLKQTLIVENRPGATTNIGASYATRAKPDGYTILLATNSTLVTNRYLYKSLPYDPDGFEPIGMISVGPMVLLSNKSHNFKSLEDVVNKARENPGALTIASFGSGTSSHLAAEYLQKVADIQLLHIPFKGSSEAMPQLINGDIDLFFDMVSTAMPQVTGGKVDATAITSKERIESYPELPTVAEQGYPDFESTAWFTLVAPPNTPAEITATLTDALQASLADDALRKRILSMGMAVADGSPQALRAQVEKERPIIDALVKRANITVQ